MLSVAWLFNFSYLAFSALYERSKHVISIVGIEFPLAEFEPILLAITTVLELGFAYFVIIATRKYYEEATFIQRLIPHSMVGLSLAFIFAAGLEIVGYVYNQKAFWIHVPTLYVNLFSFYLLYKYFVRLEGKTKLIARGCFVYFLIQAFPTVYYYLDDFSSLRYWLDTFGFFFGLVAKMIIALGMSHFMTESIVSQTKLERKYSDLLTKYMGIFLHELHKPVDAMKDAIEDILNNDKTEYSKQVGLVLKSNSVSIEHMKAIMNSSTQLYSSGKLDMEATEYMVSMSKDAHKREHISINTIAQMAITMMRDKIKKSQIDLTPEYSKEVRINCNVDQILQVILNILKNALDAIGTKGKKGRIIIRSTTDKSRKYAVLTIEDDGIGIPKELQAEVFQEGFTTKDNSVVGRGFGLSIAKKIIDLHQGKIELESPYPDDSKLGTIFRISLPIDE